jgi:elongation factor 2
LNGDATDATSKVNALCSTIRTRKGLKPDVPGYDHYYDKL